MRFCRKSSSARIDRAHGGHVQLSQHRLREKQRRDAEEHESGEARSSRCPARELNPEQKRGERAQRRDHQHRDTRDRRSNNRKSTTTPRDTPSRRADEHWAAVETRNPRARAKEIERRGDELAGLIPVKRKIAEAARARESETARSVRRPECTTGAGQEACGRTSFANVTERIPRRPWARGESRRTRIHTGSRSAAGRSTALSPAGG